LCGILSAAPLTQPRESGKLGEEPLLNAIPNLLVKKSSKMPPIPFPKLFECGLNLQAVFNLLDLPSAVQDQLGRIVRDAKPYNQLILIGSGGTRLWSVIQARKGKSPDPIDDFCVNRIGAFLKATSCDEFEFLYPGATYSGLQVLGELAGWHHDSPLRIGINYTWGMWFAYRAVVLTTSNFTPTSPVQSVNPCTTCPSRDCIRFCPANAVTQTGFIADKCFSWRVRQGSACEANCLARRACPQGAPHAYSDQQTAYHYGLSLKSIRQAKKE
jgi:hypothetical protein